jgi:hypothetical protein
VISLQQPSPRLFLREGDDGTVHELQVCVFVCVHLRVCSM